MEQDSDHSSSDDPSAAAKASEMGSDVSLLEGRVRALVAEKDQLAADLAQARSAIETAQRELVAATSRVRELTKEKDGLVADKETAHAQANVLRDKLRALDGESIFGFIQRRYFGQK
jgi:chromosome segregation ATPase